MQERLKEFLNKIPEWWNKFSARQRIFSIAAVMIAAVAILMIVFIRSGYILLIEGETTAEAYNIDNVTVSTTESDKQRKYELYLETRIANDTIARFEAVKNAVVNIYTPENNDALIDEMEDAYVSIILELDGEFTTDDAVLLAEVISKAVGNETAESIVILDTNGNKLFSGEDSYGAAGIAS
ncbi:MAG: hypothetical protein HDR10_00935 [Lachnospiraceae bacterium]|nr:hypothetical protein [Lachnospiraceae bacterium]